MADFVFTKGSDLVIRLNGDILGGVQKAVCSTKKTFSDIKEFLTDIPVTRVEEKKYEIVLILNAVSFDEIEKVESLEFSEFSRTVVFSMCNIEESQAVINSRGNVEYKVIISAEMRNVYDK